MDVLPTLERFRSEAGLAREDLYFRRDLHFNATGNALFGRAVAALLTEGSREPIPRAHSFLGKMVR
jgi:hypothetical protein